MKRGIFVTGTDTGVGKTVVAALLVSALRQDGGRPAYFKPVRTGPDDDAAEVARLAEAGPFPPSVYALRLPAAPSRAAAAEGVTISVDRIARAWSALPDSDWVVEGAGGLLVPLADGPTMRDLALALRLPLVVVASTRLGTINHTLLTLEAARARGLTVAGVVLNGPMDEGLRVTLERHDPAPVLAEVPLLPDLTAAAAAPAARDAFPAATLARLFAP